MSKTINCFVCDGKGKDYLISDLDPVEGYKMATKQVCLFCEGKGYFYTIDWQYEVSRWFYDIKRDKLKKEKEKAEEKRKKKREAEQMALRKLTLEEITLLGLEKKYKEMKDA